METWKNSQQKFKEILGTEMILNLRYFYKIKAWETMPPEIHTPLPDGRTVVTTPQDSKDHAIATLALIDAKTEAEYFIAFQAYGEWLDRPAIK